MDDLTRDEQQFPERVDWHRLTSVFAVAAAMEIAARIEDDLQTAERNSVPGLREALLIIEAVDRPRRRR